MPINNSDQAILVNSEVLDDSTGDDDLGHQQHSSNLPSFPSLPSIEDTESVNSVSQDFRKFQSNGPVDKFNFNFIGFYLLGITTMVPWNFFITAEDYWLFKFRNTTLNDTTPCDLTPMQKSFTSDLTVTASTAGTIFLILNAVYGHYISLCFKMVGNLMIILVLFIVTTAFVEINTDSWQETFFGITMAIVVLLNVCSSVMSGGLFGIAGLFPSDYMTAVVSGQALGGIFTALAFILVLTFDASAIATAFTFFSIGIATLVLSIITYVCMTRTHFFNFNVWEKSKPLILPGSSNSLDRIEGSTSLRNVFRKIYVYAISIILTFATTLSIYPAVTVLVKSENAGQGHAWNDVYFMPVVNYLIFNSGDYFGRVICGLMERPKNNPHLILMLTILRMILVPLLMTANVETHYFLPLLFKSDINFIVLMAILGLSNGYLANITLIMVPKSVMQHEKETASSIMAASLSLGLMIGAYTSLLLVQLV